jgi:hypothetical protein
MIQGVIYLFSGELVIHNFLQYPIDLQIAYLRTLHNNCKARFSISNPPKRLLSSVEALV